MSTGANMKRLQRSLRLLLFLCVVRLCAAQNDVTILRGNVTIAAILKVNELQNDVCGDSDVSNLQSLVAVTWFLEELNKMNYVPGITIGLEAYRTCTRPERATAAAVKLFDKYGVVSDSTQQNNVLFGMLGPSRTADALPVSSLIGSLPANQRVLQISGSSTGRQLSDHSTYPSFFRVIPPDEIQVKVMLELMLQLQWNYVAIVYDDDDYGRSAATELRMLAERHKVCVPVFASLPLDARSSAFLSRANEISDQLSSGENGLVRGLVILGVTSTTQQLLRSLNNHVTYVSVILSEAVVLNRATLLIPSGQVPAVSAGALVTSPPYIHIPELKPLWNELWSNRTAFQQKAAKISWLAEYFRQLTSCSADSSACWTQSEPQRDSQKVVEGAELSLYASYHVKALAVMAALLRRLHRDKCGSSASGLCADLKTSITSQRAELITALETRTLDLSGLSAVSAMFASLSSVRFNGSSGSLVSDGEMGRYTVYNFRRPNQQGEFNFQQIGSWLDDQLTINTSRAQFYGEKFSPLTWSQLPAAQCDVDHDCLKCERDVSSDVIFVEGDFYVMAILLANEKTAADPLSCGKIRTVLGADIVQSVLFAVKEVNKKQGLFADVLSGRRVGLVVINSCSNPLLVRQRLLEFHAGTMRLSEGRNSSSVLDSLMGYVGAVYSSDSIAASDTLHALGKPFVQISGASTSPDLSDETRHPYFLRLPPADDKQALAILDIAKRLDASYIQVIYDNSTSYATALYYTLQKEVATNDRYNICIAQGIASKPRDEVSQYIWIKDKLREKYSAKFVVVILHPEEIDKVLDAILPRLSTGEFILVGTDGWGRRESLIQGTHRHKLAGSLVLSLETVNNDVFQQYFQSIDPTRSLNPWLQSFWEARAKCYFNKSFLRKGKGSPCPEDVAHSYSQDTLVPFHINAVYALALGFSSALTQRCGSQATRVCSSLTSSDLFSAMLEVKLDLYGTGSPSQVFDSNGEGLVGYKVLQISPDLNTSSEHVIYKDVGVWTQNTLTFDATFTLPGGANFRSLCTDTRACEACFRKSSTTPSSGGGTAELKDVVASPVFIGAVAGLGFLLIVMIVIIVVICSRSRSQRSLKQERNKAVYFDRLSATTAVRPQSGVESPYDTLEGEGERYSHHLPPPPAPHRSHSDTDYIHAVSEYSTGSMDTL